MILNSIKKIFNEGRVILSGEITSPGFDKPENLFFSYPEEFDYSLNSDADPFFAAMLIPAMMSNEDIEIIPPISRKLILNQQTIQDIFSVWYPNNFHAVRVKYRETVAHPDTYPVKNATFFSMGVDSMYSMLKNLPQNNAPKEKRLNSLLYFKGLELPLSVYKKGQDIEVIRQAGEIARHYNLELIAGETNLRDIFPLSWEYYYCGPGLAAAALSLSNGFKNILVPSTYSYSTIIPLPSHPMVDNYWSNEKTQLIHDGAEKNRAGKIVDLIVNDPFALNNLRVCVDNEGGSTNCGKCWKCIRTMLTLEIIGKLKEAASFPPEIPKNYNLKLKAYDFDSMVFALENLNLAKKYGRTEIYKTIENEIRIGKLDQMRKGRSITFIVSEFLFYIFSKIGRRLKLSIAWPHSRFMSFVRPKIAP
jgi:hypothetical protein